MGISGTDPAEAMVGEAADLFWGRSGYEVRMSASGVNNTTRRVAAGDREYMLRLYNTHQDAAKAEFEHAVLLGLTRLEPKLMFRVPEPVPSPDGATVIRLASGKLAAVFRYIPGTAPDFRSSAQAKAYGEAVGRLSQALALVERELGGGIEPAYPPYYELDSAHAACSLTEANRFCAAPPAEFQFAADGLRLLAEEIKRIQPKLPQLRSLPHQLIHGDLNASNALVHEDGSMAALLDFEFATADLRAMEPAVCLWGLAPGPGEDADNGEEAHWTSISAFWRGYSRVVSLSGEELAVIPELMQLRSLDVFLHFLGRYQEGVDDSSVLAVHLPSAAARMQWVVQNRSRLLRLLQSK